MKPNARFSPTVTEALRRQLEQFGADTPGVQLAVLGSADGFPVASYRGVGAAAVEAPKVAAMTSSIAALGEAIARETGLEGPARIIIEADTGTVVLIGINGIKPTVALAVVAGKQAILGHLLWAARNASNAIVRLVSGDSR